MTMWHGADTLRWTPEPEAEKWNSAIINFSARTRGSLMWLRQMAGFFHYELEHGAVGGRKFYEQSV